MIILPKMDLEEQLAFAEHFQVSGNTAKAFSDSICEKSISDKRQLWSMIMQRRSTYMLGQSRLNKLPSLTTKAARNKQYGRVGEQVCQDIVDWFN